MARPSRHNRAVVVSPFLWQPTRNKEETVDGMLWVWVGFNAFVLGMLALDLGVFHRKAHTVTVKEAAIFFTSLARNPR